MITKRIFLIIWFILLIQFVYMMNFVMSDMASAIVDASERPGCTEMPDISFGVTRDMAFQDLDCMGKEGRAVYKKESIEKDSIYPVSYGLFFAFTILTLSLPVFRKKWPVVVLTVIPLIGSLFDFIENHYLRRLVDQFPNLQTHTVAMANMANIGKWSFIYTGIAIAAILTVWSFIRVIGNIRKG
ncbi:MAG: hypothetical protein GXO86_04055 [Chlorobi bacterium]|nr:hypothetical protein [Chlorobiota bacterium]